MDESKPTEDIGARITAGIFSLGSLLEQHKALQEGGLKQYAKLMKYDIGENNKGESNE